MNKIDGLYAELESSLRAVAAVHRALAGCYEPGHQAADDHGSSARASERTIEYWESNRLRFAPGLRSEADHG